jgi:hypothetical protein
MVAQFVIQPYVSHCQHGGKNAISSQGSRIFAALIMPFVNFSL